jgi:hypothetical protein
MQEGLQLLESQWLRFNKDLILPKGQTITDLKHTERIYHQLAPVIVMELSSWISSRRYVTLWAPNSSNPFACYSPGVLNRSLLCRMRDHARTLVRIIASHESLLRAAPDRPDGMLSLLDLKVLQINAARLAAPSIFHSESRAKIQLNAGHPAPFQLPKLPTPTTIPPL